MSKFTMSEVVHEEVDRLLKNLVQLFDMSQKYLTFDTAGKEMYIAKMREAQDQLKTYYSRLKLASGEGDKAAVKLLQRMEETSIRAGFDSTLSMIEAQINSTGWMERMLEKEQRLGADSVNNRVNERAIGDKVNVMFDDPELQKLLSDPEVTQAIARLQMCKDENEMQRMLPGEFMKSEKLRRLFSIANPFNK